MGVVGGAHYSTPEEVWTNAGICVKNKDIALAEHDFREALRIKPDYRDALAQMALLSFDQQDFRSEEHTSELQSLMRISYAVFCLNKTKPDTQTYTDSSPTRHSMNSRK